MSINIFKTALFLSGFLVITSCTKNTSKSILNPLLKDSQIISTRPQNSKQFIAVLKLKNPALLSSAQKIDGKPIVDAKLLKDILAEQEEAILALKNISSEIQILYRYKMVLNAVAVLAPNELQDKIKGLGQIAYSESAGNFQRPVIMEDSNSLISKAIQERNSAKFIGAESLNLEGITGKGVKVAIIDTGIDYTHSMFKGAGAEEAYKAINPSGEAIGFPSEKIVGGIDLVGTEFDSASPEFSKHIPKPDMNPLDEAGHGTHVAGTVSGLGDGVNSYNGMAPDAALYAVKVFGAEGSTSDSVVIAALEYAADPNGDGEISDQLDVVNMSLGSGYGNPHILYSEAIKNLVHGGTVVVASAGNSGHLDYIVGSPSVANEAFSIAASVDNGDQNWKFNASKVVLPTESIIVEAIEAATSKKIADAGNVAGKLVYVGLASEDFTDEQKVALKGNIAFIDRGVVNFNEKLKRAASVGVIGVVVANNAAGEAIAMGSSDKFDFPAIMIKQVIGNKIKDALKTGDVQFEFLSPEKIEKPELIDTLTGFTSKGPRSFDGFIKPEISAPGNNVISAKRGGGNAVVQMSGTSMAAPHMSGVMALLKQVWPNLSAEELKNIAMGTSKTIGEKGERYSVSLQGSGRVQADKAAHAKIVAAEPSISIGETAVESKKAIRQFIHLRNLSTADQNLNIIFEGNGYISVAVTSAIVLKANSELEIPLVLTLDATKMKDESIREMDGWIKILNGSEEVYRIPVLAIAHKLSALQASDLIVQSASSRDAVGAIATVKINNANDNVGDALLFNLLAKDERKPQADSYMTSDCDLQAAGYRLVSRKNPQGQIEDFLQVAVKTYKPMTTWNSCDISLLIDSNNDGIAEQELLGTNLKNIPNQKSEEFASMLMDATKVRELRKAFETEVESVKNDAVKLAAMKDKEKYDSAFIDQQAMTMYNNSTVVVIEALISQLAKTTTGQLKFKLVVSHNEQSSVQMDDYLGANDKASYTISLKKEDQSFIGLPEVLKLKASETLQTELKKGAGSENLLVLMPQNKFSMSDLVMDAQGQILKPAFKMP
ncbi:MAG: S8 family serine peptidase [Pseudobdellovibrio sp.]